MSKIFIVTDAWFPQVNGVVTVLAKNSELLRARGFEVTIIHPGLFKTVPALLYPELRFSIFPSSKLRALLHEIKPDYIHIETEGPLGLAALFICRRNNLAFTTAYHTHYANYIKLWTGLFFRTAYAYLRWFHNAGAATMVSTAALKNELTAGGFKNIVVRPLGVDTDFFKRNDNPPLPALPKPVFVYFGRLAKEKSVEEYLQCPLPGTKLVIGDGPQRKMLEKKYRGQAIFVGYKTGQELVDWLSLCDVFVLPSRTETFGLTVVEALACGLPVAAHDAMGPRDIIRHGVDGYIHPDLARAALACLDIPRDKCRERALHYSWDASTEAFVRNLVSVGATSRKPASATYNFGG